MQNRVYFELLSGGDTVSQTLQCEHTREGHLCEDEKVACIIKSSLRASIPQH